MVGNISLSKIVPNATDTGWSQAYSTLNFYCIITLTNQTPDKKIATAGKNILEKIQREFFALDEKNLTTIKQAVANTISDTDPSYTQSLLLVTIVKNILYIVIANSGTVSIIRSEKIGTIAHGIPSEIHAFSGFLKNNDTLIIATEEFGKKISIADITSKLSATSVESIAEHLTPLLHKDSNGTEAAIFLRYHGATVPSEKTEVTKPEETIEEAVVDENPSEESPEENRFSLQASSIKLKTPLSLQAYVTKRNIIISSIIILIIILSIILFVEKNREGATNRANEFKVLYSTSEQKYTTAKNLLTLNPDKAIADLKDAKQAIEAKINTFPKNTDERKNLEELLTQINNALEGKDTAIASKQKTIFTVNNDIKSIAGISAKGGSITIVDKSSGSVLPFEAEKPTTIIKTNAKDSTGITADESYFYIQASSALYRINKKTQKSEKIFSTNNSSSFDTFLENIYMLNSAEKTIEKYVAPSFSKGEYLQDPTTLSIKPISLSIDASIWILGENGEIQKFTKGKKEDFAVKNLPKKFDTASEIYTDSEYTNIYVLNKTSKNLVVIGKSGDYQKTLGIQSASPLISVAVDEKNKKAYIASENTIVSLEL